MKPAARSLGTAALVGLVVGVLTAYGQGWLGDSLGSLANSAGPWSLAAFVVGRAVRPSRLAVAVPAAMLTLACCEFGYALATIVRGGSNSTATIVFWLTAAVLAGPPLGLAATWSRTPIGEGDWRRGAGIGAVAGVLVGEGVYGWTTVADTTDWRYWAVETALGAAIAVAVVMWALRHRRYGCTGFAVAAALAAAVVVFATGRAF